MTTDDKLNDRTVPSNQNPEKEEKDVAIKKETGAEGVRWDLSCMYDGIDDPRLDQDIETAESMMKSFRDEFRGNLNIRLGEAYDRYAELYMLLHKIYGFLSLARSVDLRVEEIKTKQESVRNRLSRVEGEYLTFFSLELAHLDDDDVRRQAQESPTVARLMPKIEQVRRFRPHMLTEEVEAALSKREPFGSDSWSRFFDEVEADLRFDFDDKTGEDALTLTEMLDISYYDQSAERRAEAQRVIHEGFGGYFLKLSTQTMNVICQEGALEDAERDYPHPMASRNMSNKIPDDVVDALHQAVHNVAGPLSRRYYRLKATILGQETLRWSDRNAPLPFKSDRVVMWNEAVDTVLRAYGSFSPTLASLVRQMLDDRRIDAPATKGKKSGAFCSTLNLPGPHPVSYNLLNYQGRDEDVMTMAHELGHSVHGLLASEAQGVLQYSAPTAYAETASIFGEMTTFNFLLDQLREQGDTEGMLALLASQADGFLNSVVRQTGFSNFERRVHGAGRRLSPEEMNEIWMGTVYELYGPPGEVYTYEHTERLWAFIPHFHDPFYVYGYACGELFTHSLYACRDRFGDRFEMMYLDLLRAGSTKDAKELLEPFGLDPTDPKFWEDGIRNSFGKILEKMEELAAQLGYKID